MGNRYNYKTFEQWCIENNRQDLLDLWDYNLNDVLPSDVPAGTKNKYYFICPKGIHQSELKRLLTITDKPSHQVLCLECTGGYSGNKIEDLNGKEFGDLVVLNYDEAMSSSSSSTYWMCKCSCGLIVSVDARKLKSGAKTKCGGSVRHIRPKFRINDNELFNPFDPTYIKELRKTSEYRRYRKDVLEKDGYKCVICGVSDNNEVHHIYPFASYPNFRFDVKCGITLCKNHHSVSEPESFHALYGRYNNTPEQIEEYINIKRKELGITDHFDVYEYMSSYDDDNQEIDDLIFD